MPYVEGESLRERLDREHQLPVDDAVRIATDLAGALDYAHRHAVVHRDIKPANILLQEGGPVVSDFGIALAVGAAGGGRLTETGLSRGTPHYMSPEQATGDVSVGAATDIYALGCVLYEMLVAEPPYTGGTPQAVLGKIVTSEPEPVTKHRRAVAQNVDAAIRRALEKLPADCFTSARDFAHALGDTSFRHGKSPDEAAGGAGGAWGPVGAVAIVASILVGTVGGWALRGSVGEIRAVETAEVTRFSVTMPPGDRLGSGAGFSISRDEKTLVFIDGSAGQLLLLRRDLDRLELVPLPGPVLPWMPFFSPDGEGSACSTSRTTS